MNFATIKYFDIANGPGVRTSLFVSGCTHHCKGCFQPETWNFSYGDPFESTHEQAIIDHLRASWCEGLTVLGGEPMEPANQLALAPFLLRVRAELPHTNIWMYTGDVFEELTRSGSKRRTTMTDQILGTLDVLVDGPFVEARKDITLRFRGSSNQRLIDVPATLRCGSVTLWRDDPQFETHAMI